MIQTKSTSTQQKVDGKKITLQAASTLVVITIAATFPAPSMAQNASDFNPLLLVPDRPARVLQFPKDYSIGELSYIKNGLDPTKVSSKLMSGAARGTVNIPANSIVRLKASHRFFKNPQVLNDLAPDSIDSLKLTAASVEDSDDGLCDRSLQFIGHLKGLSDLNLERSDATDAGVVNAVKISNLQRLALSETFIKGSCLKQLSSLQKLNLLRLSSDDLDQTNLQYLSNMPALQHLALRRINLKAESLQYVSKCAHLKSLDISLNGTIDDSCVKYLLALKHLEYLELSGTKISVAGIKLLKTPSLKAIVMPQEYYKKADLDALRKSLPTIAIFARPRNVDQDSRVLYAPLH